MERMSKVLGQPMIVEPRPGGGGRIGAEVIARAPADGYELLEDYERHPHLHADHGEKRSSTIRSR